MRCCNLQTGREEVKLMNLINLMRLVGEIPNA